MYVYIRDETEKIYKVGFFIPTGDWHYSGFSYSKPQHAAMKVHYLNGGNLNNVDFSALLIGFENWSAKHVQ